MPVYYGMSRKQEILDTAVKLFNEQGTKAVTTNHIAAEMGISTGNLYYYFRNKEEIIREIFAEMDRTGMEAYGAIVSEHPPGSLETLEKAFVMIQKFNWRYRFFKRELTALLMADPDLRRSYENAHNSMLGLARIGIVNAVETGIFRPMDENEINLFAEEVVILILFWLNYLEIGGEEVTEESLQRGNEVLRSAMHSRMVNPPKQV